MYESNTSLALMITRNGLGEAPPELQAILVKNYFSLLVTEETIPDFVCCYGNGVKLTCKGSPVIEELKALESRGAKIIICKTCLNYFQLEDQVETGMVGTMHDIVDIQFKTGKTITI
jgi:intracellular sulfur oxidation DsrE/DsrF family protein